MKKLLLLIISNIMINRAYAMEMKQEQKKDFDTFISWKNEQIESIFSKHKNKEFIKFFILGAVALHTVVTFITALDTRKIDHTSFLKEFFIAFTHPPILTAIFSSGLSGFVIAKARIKFIDEDNFKRNCNKGFLNLIEMQPEKIYIDDFIEKLQSVDNMKKLISEQAFVNFTSENFQLSCNAIKDKNDYLEKIKDVNNALYTHWLNTVLVNTNHNKDKYQILMKHFITLEERTYNDIMIQQMQNNKKENI